MLTGIGQMELCEVSTPPIIHSSDVLLKIEYVGVCGSDVHYYETGRIGSQIVQYPYSVGHECTATIVDTGSNVMGLEKGEAVVVEPAVSCWQCDQCKAGRPHTCRNGLGVAHLSDEDHIRVLSHQIPQSVLKILYVNPDFSL